MQLNAYVTALESGGRPGGLCVFKRDELALSCIKMHETMKAIMSSHQSLMRHMRAVESDTAKVLKRIRLLIRQGKDIINKRQDFRVPDAVKEGDLLEEIHACNIPHHVAQNAKFECAQMLKKMISIFSEGSFLRDDKRHSKKKKMTQLILPFCEQVSRHYALLSILSASIDRMLLDFDILKRCIDGATCKGSLRRALLMFSNLGFERAIDRVQERQYFIRLWNTLEF